MNIEPDQRGFVRNMSAIDAVHAVRLIAEKYMEKCKTHAAFLGLEKHSISGRFLKRMADLHIAFPKSASIGSGRFTKMQKVLFDAALSQQTDSRSRLEHIKVRSPLRCIQTQ